VSTRLTTSKRATGGKRLIVSCSSAFNQSKLFPPVVYIYLLTDIIVIKIFCILRR